MSHTHFFQALSDETRLRIVMLLAREDELSVCELVHALQLSQPKVSRHLAYLRDAGVAGVRRQAQWVHYRLLETMEPWKLEIIRTAMRGLEEDERFREDFTRLQNMEGRPDRSAA